MSGSRLDPRPMEEIRGTAHEANSPSAWRRRGELLAAGAVRDFPFMAWEMAHQAATCFTIAAALAKKDQDDE